MGFVKEFRWAFSVDDVINAIIHTGPVVLGIEWHQGMYEAPNGVLTVSGPVVGGHCITAVGYKDAASSATGKESIILQNSWGTKWGNQGLAEISKDDVASLLANGGEACVPTKRSYNRK
jgi:C1A family cysteine protease